MAYDPAEQEILLTAFVTLLRSVTRDGGRKRAKGEKPPWWQDPSHEPAIWSHINKWKHGDKIDPDSGAHPLVHLAWRALAIAWQETYGQVAPLPDKEGPKIKIPQTSWALDHLPAEPVIPRYETLCFSCGRPQKDGEHSKCRGNG